MTKSEGLEKAKTLFPLGAKVRWGGIFVSGYTQNQPGTVADHYIKDHHPYFVWVAIDTNFGQKEYIILDTRVGIYTPDKDLRLSE